MTFTPPRDPRSVGHAMTIRVPDCRAAYETPGGAEFLTPPVDYDWEVRCFFRDPDGHLLELSEAKLAHGRSRARGLCQGRGGGELVGAWDHRGAGAGVGVGREGRRKAVPPPWPDSAWMVTPMASQRALTMARPRPDRPAGCRGSGTTGSRGRRRGGGRRRRCRGPGRRWPPRPRRRPGGGRDQDLAARGLERAALSSRLSSTAEPARVDVGVEGAGEAGGDGDLAAGGPLGGGRGRLREHRPDVGVDGADGELAAAEAGQVEQVLDQPGQADGLGVDAEQERRRSAGSSTVPSSSASV